MLRHLEENTGPPTSDFHPAALAAGTLIVLVLCIAGYHCFEKDVMDNAAAAARGENYKAHVLYWLVAIPVIVLVPGSFVFTNLTETAVGVVVPIYESVRAVCTPEEDDDKLWLQYWMMGGIVFMLTTWVDDILGKTISELYWYQSTIFFFYWLYFPKTQGAVLIYNRITKPFIAPLVAPVQDRLNHVIDYVYSMLVNAVHLWFLWIVFIFLPSGVKRMVAIGVGTVYPLISSIAAATTEQIDDDTYWLTYWSVYGCIFLIMDVLETWIGWVPGFYTSVIFTTVYLMLPMFQGADKLFRKVLVPLAGLRELLMLRDAINVKKEMLQTLPPHRAQSVKRAIAKFYAADEEQNEKDKQHHGLHRGKSAMILKDEMMNGWSGLRMTPADGLNGSNGNGANGHGKKKKNPNNFCWGWFGGGGRNNTQNGDIATESSSLIV